MSDNNLVTKSDLGEFYGKILPYLNGQVPIHLNQFDKSNLYSTEEKMIGQWTDGKPVYQKTFSFGPISGTGETAQSIGANVDTFVDVRGIFRDYNNWTADISYVDGSDYYLRFGLWNNSASSSTNKNTIILAYKTGTWQITSIMATVQYTKTTDSALSVKYADANDYSTTEQIVGTWINGEPLYQKTIQDTMPSKGNTKQISLSSLSINQIVYGNGMMFQTSYNTPINFSDGNSNFYWYYDKSTSKLNVKNGYTETTWDGRDFAFTIQYTKTT